ncbi:MAG: hypothetical protein QM648_10620 [Solirubrobacterales bacterium]
MSEYVVKINRVDGVLEISAPDKDWVDAKVSQLSPLLDNPTVGNSGPSRKAPPPRRRTPSEGNTKTEKPAAKKSSNSASRKNSRPQRNEALEARLKGDLAKKFRTYVDERNETWDKKKTNQAAILACFLLDELQWEGVSPDDLYTVYRILGLDAPSNIYSMLNNATARDKYFTGSTDGRFTLSLAGENLGRKK